MRAVDRSVSHRTGGGLVARFLARIALVALVALASACGARSAPGAATDPRDPRCRLAGEPTTLLREGESVLLRWELPWLEVWDEALLPQSAALASYRQAITDAGGALRHPVADPPSIDSPEAAALWQREDRNVELAFGGHAGEVRPITCLEALFFARQAERYSQIERPTEFIVAVTRRAESAGPPTVRIYFAAAASMYPPRSVYPFDAVAADVAEGWTFERMLHNHTVRSHQGRPALGVPAPGTSDVMLSRHLAATLGLQRIQVTNGFYTVDIDARFLDQYEIPPASEE